MQFFEDLLVNDRPVADVIAVDAVVVNDLLANHYGIPGVTGPEWRARRECCRLRPRRVARLRRGARQAGGGRTHESRQARSVGSSGARRALPKVPANVPPLPETPPAGLSVREITERHRQDAACAGCHARIDPYGMMLEQFDALGRLRPASELKPGDTQATLRDGTVIDGFAGLRDYLAGPRRENLLRASPTS